MSPSTESLRPFEALVALSLLRLGTDTKAPRVLKEVFREDPGAARAGRDLVGRICDALDVDPVERDSRIDAVVRHARRALEKAAAQGLGVVSIADPSYPRWLREIVDPPIVLWGRGRLDLLDAPAVAIVGSRRATPAGLALARRLAREAGAAGLVVVSGLARGIDGAAHRGALDAQAPTVGVLGNGLDVSYPQEHAELSDDVARTGALVTEFPPGTPPYPSHFPLRNRIISGLSRAVVVVEASEKSGSLITARMALEQGRDVLAVPGPVAQGCHRGCHALIKDGARLVESVEDILDELRWNRPGANDASLADKANGVSDLAATIGPGEALTLDDLARRTGRSAQHLLAELGQLEVAGRVARMAGGTFTRLD